MHLECFLFIHFLWIPLFVQNIVADMRKVLAKNPQVEQQRLHRRVFLENVNPENQALLVRVEHLNFLCDHSFHHDLVNCFPIITL